MNKLYNEFNSAIIRDEYRKVDPVSELNFNTPNNYIEFKLNEAESFYNARIQYHITGKLTKKDGTDYPANSTIKLVDNFASFLFSRIEVKKHNVQIDVVENPGITSTIKGLVKYSNNQRHTLSDSGFVSEFTGGGKFEALGTLGHLGLGFFDHLKHPMFRGGFEIRFSRAGDNDAIYLWKGTGAGATEPDEGKITIESFTLRVPIVEYDPTQKISLLSKLKSLSDSGKLIYDYLQWQCIEKKGITSPFKFDITNLFRNVYDPNFIIIGLQNNRLNSQKRDPSKFDSENIQNVSVKTNNHTIYPYENQNLDITNSKYRILYDMYQSFRRSTFRDENVYLSSKDFIKDYPLIVVDVSLHPTIMDHTKTDIEVRLDFTNNISATSAKDITAYIIVVSATYFTYDITSPMIKLQ